VIGPGPTRAPGSVPIVPGAVVFMLAMVIAVPVGVMVAGALWSAVFGWLGTNDAEADDTAPADA
jgi:hypothetical protein